MTTRGPLPRSVYWRRRAFVLGVSLAFLLILINLVRGVGNGGDQHATDTAVQTSATQNSGTDPISGSGRNEHRGKHQGQKNQNGQNSQNSQGDQGRQGQGAKQGQKPTIGDPAGPTAPVLADPTGTCADTDVTVTPQVADGTVGSTVPLTLVLRTKKAAACTWPVSAKHLALKISRFGNEIWSSRLCPNQIPSTSVVVRQAVASTLTVNWNGHRAETGCPRVTDSALPGHYTIEAASLGGPPAKSGFTLAPVVVQTPPASNGTGQSGLQGQQDTTKKTGKSDRSGKGQGIPPGQSTPPLTTSEQHEGTAAPPKR